MTLEKIKKAIAAGKLRCPSCHSTILKFEKYLDTADTVWDGAGDTQIEFSGCKVTLVCANGFCDWRQRTEYWENFVQE